MTGFLIFSAAFIALALLELRRGQSAGGYFLNNRRSSALQVGFSIAASCVGGSATVGMCGLAHDAGTPAVWWLLSGAAGLVLLRIFMLPRIRSNRQALTMPEMIASRIGAPSHRLACGIILIAWTTILAAQFLAMGRILEGVTTLSLEQSVLAGALVIVLYTWLGGQAAVMKSDVWQLVVLVCGLALFLGLLAAQRPEPLLAVRLEWLNEDFKAPDLGRFMLLIGGSYVVCPMLFARVMSARSDAAARRGAAMGIVLIALSAVIITALGVESRAWVPESVAGDAVLGALSSSLPSWAALIVFFVLASAIFSSADSCLITAATVAANDLLHTTSVAASRRLVLVISGAALALALGGRSVLGLLLAANTIYTCALVAPLFAAFFCRGPLHCKTIFWTICACAALSLASEILSSDILLWSAAALSISGSFAARALGPLAPPLARQRVD